MSAKTNGLALLIALAPLGLVQASSWLQCEWVVTIEQLESETVTWRYERFLGSDGSILMDEAECRRQVATGPVALVNIEFDRQALVPGAKWIARWFSYSAMTPDGAMQAQGWQLRMME